MCLWNILCMIDVSDGLNGKYVQKKIYNLCMKCDGANTQISIISHNQKGMRNRKRKNKLDDVSKNVDANGEFYGPCWLKSYDWLI